MKPLKFNHIWIPKRSQTIWSKFYLIWGAQWQKILNQTFHPYMEAIKDAEWIVKIWKQLTANSTYFSAVYFLKSLLLKSTTVHIKWSMITFLGAWISREMWSWSLPGCWTSERRYWTCSAYQWATSLDLTQILLALNCYTFVYMYIIALYAYKFVVNKKRVPTEQSRAQESWHIFF